MIPSRDFRGKTVNRQPAETLLLAGLAKCRYSILEFGGEINESIRGAAAHETFVGSLSVSVRFLIARA